jgi:hypothetical protein
MNDLTTAQRAAAHKRAALAQLAGVGRTHRERASELWDAQINHRSASKMRKTEFNLTEGHHLDLFVTPEWLASKMVHIADDPIFSGSAWCEPSAGTGRIAQAMCDAGHSPVFEILWTCQPKRDTNREKFICRLWWMFL